MASVAPLSTPASERPIFVPRAWSEPWAADYEEHELLAEYAHDEDEGD